MRREDDLTSRAREYESAQIAFGVVGGEGLASHFDKGDLDGSTGERHTLVYVTLGGTNAANLRGPDRGRPILCALSSLAGSSIPRKGTRVLVAIPPGMAESPGAAVIIATIIDDPERLEDDRRVLDYSGEHVIIRGKSVTLESDESEFLSVGAPRSGGTSGITIQAKDGSGAVWQVGVASMFVALHGDAKSVLQMTPDRAELMHKTSGFLRLGSGEIVALSKGKAAYLAANTFIGRSPVGGLPALGGSSVSPIPSASVFIGGLT